MEKEKKQILKAFLAKEKTLRTKFLTVKAKVTELIEEINTHDAAWQLFWKEEIGFASPARFSLNDKNIIILQPKNLYQNPINVEGIFYKEECTTVDYIEEEKPILLE